MSDTSLHWYRNKQSQLRKSIALNYESNISSVISVPLKYVCYSSKHVLSPKDKFLKISPTEITFECLNSPTTTTMSYTSILSFDDIVSFQYLKKNCLIMLTLNEPKHNTNEKLFINRIWFCLEYKSFKDYNKMLESFFNLKSYSTKLSVISQELYDSFRMKMFKCDNHENQLEFIYDWNKYLISSDKSQPSLNNNSETKLKGSLKSTKRKKEDFSCDVACKKVKNNLPKQSKSKKSEEKFVYSPSRSHSIEISSSDLNCLRSKVYINDNIINLYITYIYFEVMNENQRKQTHIFNCFFNTKLIGQSKHFPVDTDTPKIRHERVSKWTKNVDIFDKDFIIIPVIENQHWFLVIVCFPWMAGMIDYNQLLNKLEKRPISLIPENNTEFATKSRQEKLIAMKAEDPELEPMPCILVFDSLSLQRRTDKVNIIRDYLKSEWDAKRSAKDGKLIFDKSTVRGFSPKVPQQKNYTDCGVYLLHYVEMFFRQPIKTYIIEFFKEFLSDWFQQADVDKKRGQIKSIIESVIVKSESFPSLNE